MEPISASLIFIALVIVIACSGVWIFAGLIMVGVVSLVALLGFSPERAASVAARVLAVNGVSWELAAIPMFMWMGQIIYRTDISARLFNGLAPLVQRIPGGLLHTNVLGCTVFSAVSGSSTATTATVGKMTIGELIKRGYDGNLVAGSLAGAGTFGLMIPPSIAMIIYGVLSQQSISKLFMAGIMPGIMLAALFSAYIVMRAVMNPSLAPKQASVGSLWRGMVQLAPIVILMGIVLGSIYTGIATPSEAAAVGVFAAMAISAISRQLTLRMLRETLMSTVQISSMIGMLVVASALASAAVAYLHIPEALTNAVVQMAVGPYVLLIILAVFYIILGTALDGTSMLVMTVPVVLPIVVSAGWDPIWFGVYLVVMIELSALTPPVGLNINIIQGLTGFSFNRVVVATVPFFLLLCLGAAILSVFPEIVMWLPNLMK